MGPKDRQAREWAKQKARRRVIAEPGFQRAIDEQARERAARMPRVPAIAPIPQPLPSELHPNEVWWEERLNERPQHRVIRVPIRPARPTLQFRYGDTTAYASQLATFQAMEYRLDLRQEGGGTTVRWWGWEPVIDEQRRDVKRGLNRALAYAERMREAFTRAFGPPRVDEPLGVAALARDEMLFGYPVAYMREWLGVVIEDVEQALGRP